MSHVSLSEFADRLDNTMPLMAREMLRQQPEFFKMRITMPQFFILQYLSKNGDCKMTDMARFMCVTTAAVTGLVDKLVKCSLATREHDIFDRRIVRARLTKKGKKLIEEMIAKRKATVIRIFSHITEQEREDYLKIIKHLEEVLLRGKI